MIKDGIQTINEGRITNNFDEFFVKVRLKSGSKAPTSQRNFKQLLTTEQHILGKKCE